MKLRTFKLGGVHPTENKISRKISIKKLAPPKEVAILLNQHLGAPATAAVQKGDEVKVGTLIGRGESFISANIHSSVSGTVKKIDKVTNISGYKVTAVIIKVEDDIWEESIDNNSDFVEKIQINDSKDIINRIKDCGVVGLGGAAFPSHVKYMIPEGKKADTLVINGVECEPYLTSDHRLMLEKSDEILKGIEIMMKAGKVSYAVIGIEANKPDAIEVLTEKAKIYPGIEVYPLKVQYPQGAEKQLIKAVLNREIPSGGLPIDVGVIINNIGTAFAIYEAVQKNKPLIERVVTLTGKELINTGNFLVRLGTPYSDLLKALDEELPTNTGKIISGGPMMGKTVMSMDIPVTKGTSGIVLLDQKDSRRSKTRNCLRCGKCITVCPMGLEPYLLEKISDTDDFEACEKERIVDCIECGSCSYICPSSRPLLDLIRFGKLNVMRIMRERRNK
jgi:electron transport complex protein RnfC